MKLLQGDCLEVMKTIPDGSVDMVLADLPYGTTACKWDNVIPFGPLWSEIHRITKPESAICMFGSEPFSSNLRMSNMERFKYDWIWEKERGTNIFSSKYQPFKSHEHISVFGRAATSFSKKGNLKYYPIMEDGAPYVCRAGKGHDEQFNLGKRQGSKKREGHVTRNNGTRLPKSVLKFNMEHGHHPTQKPVKLLEYLIKTYTNEGETVLDPTIGSGSTGVACANLNRYFIGIEKDPKYFDIACKRIFDAFPQFNKQIQETALSCDDTEVTK